MNDTTIDSPSNLALLVLDVQKPFVDHITYPSDFLQRLLLTVEAAKCLEIRTIITEQMPEKLGRTLIEVTDVADEALVLPKSSFSALGADGFLDELRENGIEHVLIAGLEVPICVYQTALGLLDEGFGVTLLKDALGARREMDCPPIWETLCRSECFCLPVEAVIYSLLSDADHPQFKAITKLVKEYA